jgi:hypothetical protein
VISPLLQRDVVIAQLVLRLPTAGALCFFYPRDLHERAYDSHWIRSEIKPLAVMALIGETTVKFGFDDVATLEDREQLQRHR